MFGRNVNMNSIFFPKEINFHNLVRHFLQAPAPSKKKKTEEDTSPPMNLTVPKERRFKDEKSLKVTCVSLYHTFVNISNGIGSYAGVNCLFLFFLSS